MEIIFKTVPRKEEEPLEQGWEMGVFPDSTPFLSESSLASICQIDRRTLSKLSTRWKQGLEQGSPRGKKLDRILSSLKYTDRNLYISFTNANGVKVKGYPEAVCLAIIEYYAFTEGKESVANIFRFLATKSFRTIVYENVGYDQNPETNWTPYHDRVSLNETNVPVGYYGIFHEISGIVLSLVTGGLPVDDATIPDISVGKIWSTHWKNSNFDERFGKRISYEHNYPPYFPQSQRNPHSVFAYPEESLGTFRAWLRETYVASKFPKYLNRKKVLGHLKESEAVDIRIAVEKSYGIAPPSESKTLPEGSSGGAR
jgi:hypothetical protein